MWLGDGNYKEKLFEKGVKWFGWGRWGKIANSVGRYRVQVWRFSTIKVEGRFIKSNQAKTACRICKTAKEAWDMLAAHFTKNDLSSQTDLHKAINAIQFSWDEGLDKYVQKHREARQRFEDAGVKNSEAFYLSVFLSNLPEDFETVIDILESQEDTTTIAHTLFTLDLVYR
jgi:hypothetical protein